jgi:hypothetical protein
MMKLAQLEAAVGADLVSSPAVLMLLPPQGVPEQTQSPAEAAAKSEHPHRH